MSSRRPAFGFVARVAAALAVGVAVAGCVISGGAPGGGGQVPAGPLGPVLDDPLGGPPIECRGVPQDHCLDAGHVDPAAPGPPDGDVVRVIVTCTTKPVCTPQNGEYRVDAVGPAGTTVELSRGAYASVGAP